MLERTLVLVKPDGVRRSLMGEILQRFERTGLKIVAMRMLTMDRDFAKRHYAAHVDKDFYPRLENFIVSGPVVAMVVEGLHAVEMVRKLVGETEPRTASPGTIRGDFAMHSYAYTRANDKAVSNLVHASGDQEDAAREVALWFSPEEIQEFSLDVDNDVL